MPDSRQQTQESSHKTLQEARKCRKMMAGIVRYMELEPKCECGKPIVALVGKIKLTEDRFFLLIGYCEDRCKKIVSTCNTVKMIKVLKEHYAEGLENVM